MTKQLKAVVLAAGKGTRMQSEGAALPKVMRTALGQPLLHYVLAALDFIPKSDCVLVVGFMEDRVMEAFPGYTFAHQTEQLGTGHAVMCAGEALGDFSGSILVCCGDMPLIRRETYEELCREHFASGNACTILSGESDVYLPYGRILRDENGRFTGVVEEKDADDEQKKITELNAGVYVFEYQALRSVLSRLSRSNAQGEYYLTDAPALMQSLGMKVGVCRRGLGLEIIGVNTPDHLATVEDILSKNRN